MATLNSVFGMASSAALGGVLALSPLQTSTASTGNSMSMRIQQVGSGGVATPVSILAGHRWSDSAGNLSVRLGASLPADEQLAYVRNVLGISITDLAELLDVARPTVYSWMQDAQPRDEHLSRLQRIEQFAREVEMYGLAGAGKLLKRPLQSGTTLLQLMKANQPIASALSELAGLSRHEERQRSVQKGSEIRVTAAEAAAGQSMSGYASRS